MAKINKVAQSDHIKKANSPQTPENTVSKRRRRNHKRTKNHDSNNVKQGQIGQFSQKSEFSPARSATIAQRVGSKSLERTRELARNEDYRGEQEPAEQFESLIKTSVKDTGAAISQKANCYIRKKTPDIRNTRDIKSSVRSIRIADNSARTTEKMTREITKSATEAGKQAFIATEKVMQAKRTELAARKSAEWVKRIVKGIIESTKAFIGAICASSVPLVLVLVIAGMIAAIVASSFGIFFAGSSFSGSNTDGTPTLQETVLSINQEYTDAIEAIKTNNPHDELVIVGGRSAWQDVLAIYAVSVTTDPDNPMDVVTMTDDRIEILRTIFWEINTITYETEEVTETISVQAVDDEGNPETDDEGNPVMEDQETVTTVLHITINHISAQDESSSLGFSDAQNAQLAELLDVRYASLWIQILRGVGLGSDELVTLALSQIGNDGGEKFWRWAGLDSRCPWCALFVSWCADQTGLLASGKIPYFSFVTDGVAWFQANDKWIDGSEVDSSNYDQIVYPGMLVFFDWEQDGIPDHVGIVTNAANGYIYTIEGNNGDAVAEAFYMADNASLFGFGLVA